MASAGVLVALLLGSTGLSTSSVPSGGFLPRTALSSESHLAPLTATAAVNAEFAHRLVTTPLEPNVGNARCCYPGQSAWVTFDSGARDFIVAVPPHSIDVVSGKTLRVREVIHVGSSPFDAAVDPASGLVFVTDRGSAQVSVVNLTLGRTVLSIPVRSQPTGIVFDATDDRMFVADSGVRDLSVINATSDVVVANVSVGTGPLGLAWDPATDQVFAALSGAGEVAAVSGSADRVVAHIVTGSGPDGIAVDTASDAVYVSNNGSNTVSEINPRTDALNVTIAVPEGQGDLLQGVAYDAQHGAIWVAGGDRWTVVINATENVVVDYVFIDPSGAAYDPIDGQVCVTNSANETFACFVFGTPAFVNFFGYASSIVTFVESGLPAGTEWKVRIVSANGPTSTASAWSSSIVIGVFPYAGNNTFVVVRVPGYSATPTSGTLSGGSTIAITFT